MCRQPRFDSGLVDRKVLVAYMPSTLRFPGYSRDFSVFLSILSRNVSSLSNHMSYHHYTHKYIMYIRFQLLISQIAKRNLKGTWWQKKSNLDIAHMHTYKVYCRKLSGWEGCWPTYVWFYVFVTTICKLWSWYYTVIKLKYPTQDSIIPTNVFCCKYIEPWALHHTLKKINVYSIYC